MRKLDAGRLGQVQLNPFSPVPKKGTGCLACPILPTIKGVEIGTDYCGGRSPEGTIETHRLLARGNDNPRVLIVMHNPSVREDKEGKIGDSRELREIKSALSEAGIDYRKNVVFTYAVKCYAQGAACANTGAAKACSPFLSREIQKFDPEFIVPVGSTPLKMICGPKYRIDTCHGSPFEQEVAGKVRKVMPVFTPGTLFYRDVLRPQWEKAWNDLSGLLTGRLTIGKGLGKYKWVKSAEEAARMLDSYTSGDVSFDYETNCLDPMNTRVVVPQIKGRDGFQISIRTERDPEYIPDLTEEATVAIVSWSNKPGVGYYVVRDHAHGTWTDKDREVFDAAFKRFLTRRAVCKVVHNAMFEQTWSKVYFGVPVVNFYDTMVAHHQVDEEAPHSLDNVATQYTGMGNWKQSVTQVAEHFAYNYRHIPLDIIGPYAGADADATLRLKGILSELLDKKRKHLVVNYYPMMIDALSDMQVAGTHGDMKAARFFEQYTSLRAHNSLDDMRALPVVRKYIRRKESEDDRRGKKDEWKFNTNSPDQIKEILYGELGYEPLKYTDAAEEADGEEEDFDVSYGSSDKDSLNHFVRTKQCAFSASLLQFRRYDKQHSTYAIPYLVHLDLFAGSIRGNFKPTGTKTGRTSSAGPNLQNAPMVAKRVYTSRFGDLGCILALDYSQIEVRVAASLAQEKLLLDAYKRGEDVHTLTMCRIFDLTVEQAKQLEKSDLKKYKKQRTIAKRVVFGCVPMDTEVLTPEGWKTHDQVREGDRVMGHLGGVLKWVKVLEKAVYPDAPIDTMRSKLGNITATPNHRWFVFNEGKVTVKEQEHITKNDRLCLALPMGPTVSKPDSKTGAVDRAGILANILIGRIPIHRLGEFPSDLVRYVLDMSTAARKLFVRVIYGRVESFSKSPKTIKFPHDRADFKDAVSLALFLEGYFPFVAEAHGFWHVGPRTGVNQLKPVHSKGAPGRVWCVRTESESWVARQGSTIFLTGNTLYGIGGPGIVNTLRQEGIIVTEEEAQEYIDRFFGVYRKIRQYIDDTNDFVYENGHALSPFGRRRHLPDIHSEDFGKVGRAKRQGPNAVIQSTASDMTVTAIILINRELKRRKFKSRLVMTVHDSIVLDCVRTEAAEVCRIALDIMENLPERAAEVWGADFDWSWLRCPIVAEAEVGLNWRDCVAFRPGVEDDGKTFGNLKNALAKAEELQKKEDRKARDTYLHAKMQTHRHRLKPEEVKLLKAVSDTVKPDASDGVPLGSETREKLRALVKEYTGTPE